MALFGMALHAEYNVKASAPVFARKVSIVRQLGLTDLCLFTEASYTRHISMTDMATPFQDSPATFEHFPTGALVSPPSHLVSNHVQKD